MEHTIIPGEEAAPAETVPTVVANTAAGGAGIVVAPNGSQRRYAGIPRRRYPRRRKQAA